MLIVCPSHPEDIMGYKGYRGQDPILWIEGVRKLRPAEKHFCCRSTHPDIDARFEVTICIEGRYELISLFVCWEELAKLRHEIKERKLRKVG